MFQPTNWITIMLFKMEIIRKLYLFLLQLMWFFSLIMCIWNLIYRWDFFLLFFFPSLSNGAKGSSQNIVHHSFWWKLSHNAFILSQVQPIMLFPVLTLADIWNWEGIADTVLGPFPWNQSFFTTKKKPGFYFMCVLMGVRNEKSTYMNTCVWRCPETCGRKQL